ncbi:MAG: hypothetical protein FJZ96_13390 [Chloroflexi bacterium]|nr:hypothetical protein [Chloroflexota bacterium]
MKLSGLHVLLTYQCLFECDHCFVWGSPRQEGALTLDQVGEILRQARAAGVEWIYFEGGEPFLYYATLLAAVKQASAMGFRVGVVSNAYWAHSPDDALACLRPFSGLLEDLSISSDLYHYSQQVSRQALAAQDAAGKLGIPIGVISVCQPETPGASPVAGVVTGGGAAVMYRGRAVQRLVSQAATHPWQGFDACPHEDLREPGRVHLDPLGNLHICQGLVIGNLFEAPLDGILAAYDPDHHPLLGPLASGGPAALVQEYALPHAGAYADACHLCYEARLLLRSRFPECLKPGQMYGENLIDAESPAGG